MGVRVPEETAKYVKLNLIEINTFQIVYVAATRREHLAFLLHLAGWRAVSLFTERNEIYSANTVMRLKEL